MEDPSREMEMISTCIESVLRDLELLEKNLRFDYSYMLHSKKSSTFTTLKMNLPWLRTFLWGARKWGNNDVYSDLESNGMNLQSFLSTIEENLKKYKEDIHSLCLRPQSEYVVTNKDIDILSFIGRSKNQYISAWEPVICGFRAKVGSFEDGIHRVYHILLGRCSFRRYCFRDDELVEFADHVLQNLKVLLRPLLLETSTTVYDNKMALHAQIEALQDELTFLKNLIRFAKLRGIERGLLEALLILLQFAGLSAAFFAYNCSFHVDYEEVEVSVLCSTIGELLDVMKPVKPRLLQMYINALKASKSSALLRSIEMARHIMGDINDSLISRLWPLLWSSRSLDLLKDKMLTLYEGLRFLRSILRKQQENVLDELNGTIVDVIICVGIVICWLFASEAEQIPCPPLVFVLLVGTNKRIQHIKDQISRSSMIRSLPSDHCFTGKNVGNSSRASNPLSPNLSLSLCPVLILLSRVSLK